MLTTLDHAEIIKANPPPNLSDTEFLKRFP